MSTTIDNTEVRPETYTLELGNLKRELVFVRPTPNTRLPLLEFLGDTELTEAACTEMRKSLPSDTEVLFTCETSSIVLAHKLSEITGLGYEVARKRRRSYMHNPLIQEVASMTLGVGETLWLDGQHAARLKGKKVTVVLDVVSSGGTLTALERLARRAGADIVGRIAAFSQGKAKTNTLTLGELPIIDVGR
jgi:adenine phosphoribosyltransferase